MNIALKRLLSQAQPLLSGNEDQAGKLKSARDLALNRSQGREAYCDGVTTLSCDRWSRDSITIVRQNGDDYGFLRVSCHNAAHTNKVFDLGLAQFSFHLLPFPHLPLLNHARDHLPSLSHCRCPRFRACSHPVTVASRGVELRDLLLHDLGRSSLPKSVC